MVAGVIAISSSPNGTDSILPCFSEIVKAHFEQAHFESVSCWGHPCLIMLFDNAGHSYCTALCPIGPAMAHSFAVRVSAFFCCPKAFTMNLMIAG
jgi:hypothetical protein